MSFLPSLGFWVFQKNLVASTARSTWGATGRAQSAALVLGYGKNRSTCFLVLEPAPLAQITARDRSQIISTIAVLPGAMARGRYFDRAIASFEPPPTAIAILGVALFSRAAIIVPPTSLGLAKENAQGRNSISPAPEIAFWASSSDRGFARVTVAPEIADIAIQVAFATVNISKAIEIRGTGISRSLLAASVKPATDVSAIARSAYTAKTYIDRGINLEQDYSKAQNAVSYPLLC